MNVDSQQAIPLRQHVQNTISRYLQDMGNTVPENLYQMLLAEIEPPLIEEMQRYSINAKPGKITRLRR
jgi:Fis family transcriptional regulator